MRALLAGLLDLCFPPRCLACDDRSPHPGTPLCRACLRGLPDPVARCEPCGRRIGPLGTAPVETERGCLRCTGPLAEGDALSWAGGTRALRRRAVRRVVAAWSYGGVPRDLVVALKFRRRLAAADLLAHALAGALRRVRIPGDLVVPVPLSRRRRRERGYDQAAMLARGVARRLGLAYDRRALARRRHTVPQTSLPRAARRRGPVGAFRARPRRVAGRCVLLVDDVLTSGGTVKACALALRRAGALSVTAAVACRAERAPRA